ncbi:MAG: hypothetical protein JXR55_02390 [Candidatus Fermentibacteraceae bacterium]|nr:hypothetical protein [Candidatus Fermentibacteraceae bacterium]
MKTMIFAVLALILALSSCGNGVVTPGNDIRGSLSEKIHTLADAWEGAEAVLFAMGRPMALDVYTEVHEISGSGIMVIDVRSFDFDPIAAVINGSGELVAFNDNWKETANARIVLDGAPSGGRLLVFSSDDSRGLYDVIVREGTANDLESYSRTTDLSTGMLTGWLEPGAYNPVLESILREALENYVYNYNYAQAQLFPFTLENDDLVSISLESDSFDPYLVLMSVEGGEYIFVDYNDDYNGSYSRIVRELEAGNYIAVVMPYSTGGYGEFELRMESVNRQALEPVGVDAEQQGVDHEGRIESERNFAIAWWPGMTESWEVPSFLDPFSPVAAFTFNVSDPSIYRLTACGEMDICLTVLREDTDYIQYISSNDDYMDLGTDSRVVEPLMPGSYIALISSYSGTDQGEVTFSWEREDTDIPALRSGRSVEEFVPYETETLIFQLSLMAGQSYSVSVESQELDPVITLYMPDGVSLYDDDGGEGTNSLLSFTTGERQGGTAFLVVEKYSSGEGTFSIEFH